MPDFDYIESPRQECFHSDGGEFKHFEKKYGFSLAVPPKAVAEDKQIRLKVGLCCYGMFSINENYQLASDFAVIVADDKFSKPVEVSMDHCLILPEYQKCSDVVILKADHLKVTNKDNLYTFDFFKTPEVLPDAPRLSFETEEFCILCAALKAPSYSSSSSSSVGHAHVDDENPSSVSSSFDTEFERTLSTESRSLSIESRPLSMSRALSAPSDCGPEESPLGTRKRKSESLESEPSAASVSPQKRSNRARAKPMKRRNELRRGGGSVEKRYCGIEYAALLFQPEETVLDSPEKCFQFVIFICLNCSGAHKVYCSYTGKSMYVLCETPQAFLSTHPREIHASSSLFFLGGGRGEEGLVTRLVTTDSCISM